MERAVATGYQRLAHAARRVIRPRLSRRLRWGARPAVAAEHAQVGEEKGDRLAS